MTDGQYLTVANKMRHEKINVNVVSSLPDDDDLFIPGSGCGSTFDC